MAVAMTTYGSTLSDLQRLTNEDRALDYQRANFQDSINAQRLSDFLKARSEENKTKSQRDAEAAKMLDSQQDRAQRGTQFNTQQQNLMKIEEWRNTADATTEAARARSAIDLAKLQGSNALEVAKVGAQQMDPRTFQYVAQIEAENRDSLADFNLKKSLSDERRAAVRERNTIQGNKGAFDVGAPNAGFFNRSVDPRWTALNERIAQLDSEAIKLGLREGPDGGYVIPAYTPIKVPAMLNQGGSPMTPATTPAPAGGVVLPYLPENQTAPAQVADPFPFLSTDAPPARTNAVPVRRFRVTPDGQFMPQ